MELFNKLINKIRGINNSHVSHKLKGKKRLPSESFKEYKARIKKEDKLLKEYLKGELVWYPGGKKSKSVLAQKCLPTFDKNGDMQEPELNFELAQKILDRGKGTLKGNPKGKLQPNGLPERSKPVLDCTREI